MSDAPLLDVRGLTVEFHVDDERLRAVDDVSFVVRRGEIVGLVGESGAGKSLTSEAILGLIPCPPGRVTGEVRFRDRNLLELDEPALARIRGKDIAMIFQNPTGSLNPVFRVGDQLHEAMALHLRSEEHTSELQSQSNLVCRLLLEKKKKKQKNKPRRL